MPKYKLDRGQIFVFSLARGVDSYPCRLSVMPLIRCVSNMNSHKFF